LRLSRERVVNPGTIVIHVRNLGTETTSLSAFRSLTTSQLRDRLAGALPSGGESPFVGEVVVAPGEEADLVLVDLAPDTYTVVAGLHGPGGTLQIRDAFSASLTVATP
ncbi:MAG TPA: hypothetical protein VKB09_09040, partial [Thermomicrobiales bacterium]|nr:hypothetical protein [Thermomicrobiales bacterium]